MAEPNVVTHGLSFTASDWRWAGALLVAGLIVFLVGAGGWKPAEFQVSLPDGLRAMARYRGRIQWITTWMTCGMVLTAFGLAALRGVLREHDPGVSGAWFVGLFAVASVCMVGFLWILRAVVLRVPLDPAAPLPDALLTWRTVAGGLFVVHTILGYGTWIALGLVARQTAALPDGLGWTGIVGGGAFLLGFIVLRGGPFAPPFILHLFTAATGVTMLLRGPPG